MEQKIVTVYVHAKYSGSRDAVGLDLSGQYAIKIPFDTPVEQQTTLAADICRDQLDIGEFDAWYRLTAELDSSDRQP